MRTLPALILVFFPASFAFGQPLPGTKPLEIKGDLAAHMVSGINKYLVRATKKAAAERKQFWNADFSSLEGYRKSIEPNRERFKKIIGVADKRAAPSLAFVATPEQPALIAEDDKITVHSVRWSVLPGMFAEGLLLKPKGKVRACVVAIPDADISPEAYAGVQSKNGKKVDQQQALARRLAQNGCLVLVPTLIDRQDTWSGNPQIGRMTNQPHREFVYRMAYQMGRHVIGYEVQKVLAAVDWFDRMENCPPIGVVGYGEGGLIAFYSGACDRRIGVVGVSGYFGRREEVWKEPIYRNVWGLVREFGDNGIAGLIAPRTLVIEDHRGPQIEGPPAVRPGRRGAAPGSTTHFNDPERGLSEAIKAKANFYDPLNKHPKAGTIHLIDARKSSPHSSRFLAVFFHKLAGKKANVEPAKQAMIDRRKNFEPQSRQKRQFDQAVAFTQKLLPAAVKRRDQYWSKMDTSSLEKWKDSTKPYKDYFHDEIIGRLPKPKIPMNPRTRLVYETKKWKGYEVVLDLYDEVICYGMLLVPNDIKPGEKRPVVVCQHGLEGRPADVCNPNKKTRAYNSFGAALADMGYIVFAPQNPYIGRDDFRVLVRMGHPIKLSLYSFIVEQHERILDWLETLPFVDARRIAFYGLSYGGKTAMRIGALVGRYCVVICSGDFNEWIWKNINLVWRGSYMFTIEYDMYEFDLGDTFNYAEMARLIAPRPFMVERGHNDGVGLDEWVAHEFARVRRLYSRLGMADRTEIEYFAGGHEIHGQGTYRFLDRHLKGQRN